MPLNKQYTFLKLDELIDDYNRIINYDENDDKIVKCLEWRRKFTNFKIDTYTQILKIFDKYDGKKCVFVDHWKQYDRYFLFIDKFEDLFKNFSIMTSSSDSEDEEYRPSKNIEDLHLTKDGTIKSVECELDGRNATNDPYGENCEISVHYVDD